MPLVYNKKHVYNVIPNAFKTLVNTVSRRITFEKSEMHHFYNALSILIWCKNEILNIALQNYILMFSKVEL